MIFFVFNKHKNNIVVLLTLGKSKKIVAFSKFRQVTWMVFNLNKTPLGETGCLSNPYFFTYCLLKHPVFLIHPLSQHSQLGYLWLPTPQCAALV